MSKITKIIFYIIFSSLLVSCATKSPYYSIPHNVKEGIKTTDVLFIEPTNQIQTDIEKSYLGSGGGLIPCIIDSAIESGRKKSAEKQLNNIKNSIKDLNLQEEFITIITPVLADNSWIGYSNINYKVIQKKETENEIVQKIIKFSNSDSLMVLTVNYKFCPDFSTMKGIVKIAIYPASNRLIDLSNKRKNKNLKPVYYNEISSSFVLESPSKEKEKNTKIWTADGGYQLRNALSQINLGLKSKLEWQLQNTDIVSSSK